MKGYKKKRVVIRVEISKRELMSKLLLALYLAKRNYNVVITSRLFNNTKILRSNDVVITNSAYQNMYELLLDVRNRVGQLLLMDEEALVIRSSTEYLNRLPLKCVELFDAILCIGEYHKEILDSKFSNSSRHILIGNPRLNILSTKYDYLRYETRNKIRSKYGNYILIVSNFGTVNVWGSDIDFLSRFESKKKIFQEQGLLNDFDDFKKRFSHYESIFQSFIKLIPVLADKFERILIRVHPAEDPKIWHQVVSQFDNVEVNEDFDLNDIIYASECVVQNGCTSALEAYLLGKPCYSYRPRVNDSFDQLFPTYISKNVYNENTLVNELEGYFSNQKFNYDNDNFNVNKYIYNYKNDDYFNDLLNFLNDCDNVSELKRNTRYNIKSIIENYIFRIAKSLYNTHFFKLIPKRIALKYQVHFQKVGSFNIDEIKHCIKLLCHNGESDKYNVSKITTETYKISFNED